MAFNGHQRDDDTVEEDETPTKQPRSNKEMPGCVRNEPNNEAAAPAGRAASERRTSNSTTRHRKDSVKKTRPRRCPKNSSLGDSVCTGKRIVVCAQK